MKHIPYIKIRADEKPSVIFKMCADAMAEYELANITQPNLPKYEKPKVVKNKAGWKNFFLQLMP